jgi:hypothetical protein
MFDSIDKILKINTLIFILYFRLSIKYEEYFIQRIFSIFLFQNFVVLIEKNENEKKKF